MPAFASAALATAVALSALGAVVLCVLVVLYGFPAGDEGSPERATRRLILTRVGHALAATCFTATAILIATVLVQRAPPVVPVAAPPPEPDSRVPALGERIEGQEARLSQTEARLRELEDALRRRDAAPPRPAVEPSAPPPPPPRPAARTPGAAAPARSKPRASATPIDETVKPPTAVASPSTSRGVDAAPLPPPSPSPPSLAPRPAPSPPFAAVQGPGKPADAPPAPSASRPAPRRTRDVPDKLREDWREIQRGVDSAGDDFRSAVDGLRRRLLGDE
jgi:hypothetical protein